MATSGSKDSGGYQGRVLRFEWGTNSTNPSTNVRNIWYRITAVGGTSSMYYHHTDYVNINGTRVYTGAESYEVWNNTVLASGNMDIDQDDYSSLTVSMHGGIYSRTDNINTDYSWSLDDILRYATISASVASRSFNSVRINWSTDVNVDTFQYRLPGDEWVNAETNINKRSGSFTIPDLSPNTSYTIEFDAKRTDSQKWSTHGGKGTSVTVKTYDIAKISSVSDFYHGDNAIVVTTNPSGSTLDLTMKIDNTDILSKTVQTGNNEINFTDEELDSIYRKYGCSNQLTATFILRTANNSNYTDTKTATITLTGNQKTAHVSQGRAKAYGGVNGNVKKGVVWIGNNGRKRCI